EVVRAVEDNVGIGDERPGVAWYEVGDQRGDIDAGVHAGKVEARCLGLGEALPRIVLVEEHLTLEVRGLHVVAVDECKTADAGACKEAGRRRPGGSDANDGRMAAGEALLTVISDGREEHLAGVAFAVVDRVAR